MSSFASSGLRPAELLPDLHRRLHHVTGGRRSLVLRQTPTGDYKGVSALGLPLDTEPWIAGADAGAPALAVGAPAVLPASAVVPLATWLQAPRVLLLPVAPVRSPTVIAVGIDDERGGGDAAVADIVQGIAAALELARAERDIRFHQRLRELLRGFSQGVPSTLHLASALDALVHDV